MVRFDPFGGSVPFLESVPPRPFLVVEGTPKGTCVCFCFRGGSPLFHVGLDSACHIWELFMAYGWVLFLELVPPDPPPRFGVGKGQQNENPSIVGEARTFQQFTLYIYIYINPKP